MYFDTLTQYYQVVGLFSSGFLCGSLIVSFLLKPYKANISSIFLEYVATAERNKRLERQAEEATRQAYAMDKELRLLTENFRTSLATRERQIEILREQINKERDSTNEVD